jgi:hypothetical protein
MGHNSRFKKRLIFNIHFYFAGLLCEDLAEAMGEV